MIRGLSVEVFKVLNDGVILHERFEWESEAEAFWTFYAVKTRCECDREGALFLIRLNRPEAKPDEFYAPLEDYPDFMTVFREGMILEDGLAALAGFTPQGGKSSDE